MFFILNLLPEGGGEHNYDLLVCVCGWVWERERESAREREREREEGEMKRDYQTRPNP